MNKRQAKNHYKKSMKLGLISLELSERYLKRYRTNYYERNIKK